MITEPWQQNNSIKSTKIAIDIKLDSILWLLFGYLFIVKVILREVNLSRSMKSVLMQLTSLLPKLTAQREPCVKLPGSSWQFGYFQYAEEKCPLPFTVLYSHAKFLFAEVFSSGNLM